MSIARSRIGGYLLAAVIGGLAGVSFTLVASRAIPRMVSRLMVDTMVNIRAQMGDEACDAADI